MANNETQNTHLSDVLEQPSPADNPLELMLDDFSGVPLGHDGAEIVQMAADGTAALHMSISADGTIKQTLFPTSGVLGRAPEEYYREAAGSQFTVERNNPISATPTGGRNFTIEVVKQGQLFGEIGRYVRIKQTGRQKPLNVLPGQIADVANWCKITPLQRAATPLLQVLANAGIDVHKLQIFDKSHDVHVTTRIEGKMPLLVTHFSDGKITDAPRDNSIHLHVDNANTPTPPPLRHIVDANWVVEVILSEATHQVWGVGIAVREGMEDSVQVMEEIRNALPAFGPDYPKPMNVLLAELEVIGRVHWRDRMEALKLLEATLDDFVENSMAFGNQSLMIGTGQWALDLPKTVKISGSMALRWIAQLCLTGEKSIKGHILPLALQEGEGPKYYAPLTNQEICRFISKQVPVIEGLPSSIITTKPFTSGIIPLELEDGDTAYSIYGKTMYQGPNGSDLVDILLAIFRKSHLEALLDPR